MKIDTTLLGKQVMPLVKRNQFSGSECDRRYSGGAGAWLKGDNRINHYRRAVDKAVRDARKDNKDMEWYVFSIHASGNFDLRSTSGFEQRNCSRNDFRLIKGGKVW